MPVEDYAPYRSEATAMCGRESYFSEDLAEDEAWLGRYVYGLGCRDQSRCGPRITGFTDDERYA